jgi:hypothetical protein
MFRRSLKLTAVAAASGIALVLWLRAPVLGTVSLGQWQAVGVGAAAIVAGTGALVTESWVAEWAVSALGFVAGAAYLASFSDIRVGLVDAVVSSLLDWRELHLPWAAGAFAGAFTAHIERRRRAWPRSANTGNS